MILLYDVLVTKDDLIFRPTPANNCAAARLLGPLDAVIRYTHDGHRRKMIRPYLASVSSSLSHRHEVFVDVLAVVLEEHLASADLAYQRTQAHPIAASGETGQA